MVSAGNLQVLGAEVWCSLDGVGIQQQNVVLLTVQEKNALCIDHFGLSVAIRSVSPTAVCRRA